MLRTITLDVAMPFADALTALLAGKCLGIRPGNNTNYVEMFKPGWMNEQSPDFMLRWSNSEGDASIRTNQYLEPWFLVVLNHRSLPELLAAKTE